MRAFPIAGIQMQLHYGHDNIPAMRQRLDALMQRFPWVEMVVYSELAPFGASIAHAQPLPGPAEEQFCAMARQHALWLIPGSMFERAGERVYNTASVIDPHGRVVGRYRKMFPFRPYEAGVTGGTDFLTWEVPGVGRFGLSICFDMWFPETTRTLAVMGAEAIIHPTLTDTVDRDVELSIARASAAMNQCFFFAVNGVGAGGNGRSIVTRPSGGVMFCAGSGEESFPLHIELDDARRNRANGLFGLGQMLKSFRDRDVDFAVYQPDGPGQDYLASLGPLVKPRRHARAAHIPPHSKGS
jgi:deaminated glutathione amidase